MGSRGSLGRSRSYASAGARTGRGSYGRSGANYRRSIYTNGTPYQPLSTNYRRSGHTKRYAAYLAAEQRRAEAAKKAKRKRVARNAAIGTAAVGVVGAGLYLRPKKTTNALLAGGKAYNQYRKLQIQPSAIPPGSRPVGPSRGKTSAPGAVNPSITYHKVDPSKYNRVTKKGAPYKSGDPAFHNAVAGALAKPKSTTSAPPPSPATVKRSNAGISTPKKTPSAGGAPSTTKDASPSMTNANPSKVRAKPLPPKKTASPAPGGKKPSGAKAGVQNPSSTPKVQQNYYIDPVSGKKFKTSEIEYKGKINQSNHGNQLAAAQKRAASAREQDIAFNKFVASKGVKALGEQQRALYGEPVKPSAAEKRQATKDAKTAANTSAMEKQLKKQMTRDKKNARGRKVTEADQALDYLLSLYDAGTATREQRQRLRREGLI